MGTFGSIRSKTTRLRTFSLIPRGRENTLICLSKLWQSSLISIKRKKLQVSWKMPRKFNLVKMEIFSPFMVISKSLYSKLAMIWKLRKWIHTWSLTLRKSSLSASSWFLSRNLVDPMSSNVMWLSLIRSQGRLLSETFTDPGQKLDMDKKKKISLKLGSILKVSHNWVTTRISLWKYPLIFHTSYFVMDVSATWDTWRKGMEE